ncbi:MAG TPA: ABC transporter permease [Nocardioides sp.]|uniref:ABC transporter permease n=1 Tax=Nocardioides sp. TaxID=35761 RepID=UPI002E30304D|nr:ABC transporter permease [Nocardioides sp.]HEX5090423.1 ABC transporter permease [Nocardioides sp.]
MVEAVVRYTQIARLWVRASRAYPVSWAMLIVGGFLITGIDFVGIWILFQNVEHLGGFDLHEVAFLYGGTGVAFAVADLFAGRIERLGQMIRLGRLDQMLVRPVPLLVQVCADEFALRRVSRIAQAALVLGWACTHIEWTRSKVVLTVLMLVAATIIFVAVFVGLACIQFWTIDSAEVANAFTYGGNTITSYPLSIFPSELIKAMTFAVPLAFVNWYPSLHILGHPDPLGYPDWTQWLSPVIAVVVTAGALRVWQLGVRSYRSTGS